MAKKPATPITPPGITSFPAIFEQSEISKGTKFETTLIFPEETDLSDLEDDIQTAGDNKWGKGKWPKNTRVPLKDNANRVGDDGEPKAGYEKPGRYIKFWSRRPPAAVARDRDPSRNNRFRKLDEHEVYAGCWARVSYNIYAFHNKEFGTNDIIAEFLNYQKWDDGDPIAGMASDPDADFGEAEDDLEALLAD